jgi:D-lactate dehydrogenase
MRKNVIIVNTSRGEVVNTPDLVDGLKSGKVFGAALDVFEGEKAFMFKDMTQKGYENYPELQVIGVFLNDVTKISLLDHLNFSSLLHFLSRDRC